MTRARATTTRIKRQPADRKITFAEAMCCPHGHDFGLDRQKLYAWKPNATHVSCPLCGAATSVQKASAA